MPAIDDDAVHATEERVRVEALDKRIAGLQARFALQGWTLHVGASGGLIAARWGRTRDLNLAEADALVAKLEGGHAP